MAPNKIHVAVLACSSCGVPMHPEATGAEKAKQQVERALDAIVASL